MEVGLKQRMDAFVRGEFGELEFIDGLRGVCAGTPELAWDVLAITDQFYRRGKISAELCRGIRDAIARPALERQSSTSASKVPLLRMTAVVGEALAAPASAPKVGGAAMASLAPLTPIAPGAVTVGPPQEQTSAPEMDGTSCRAVHYPAFLKRNAAPALGYRAAPAAVQHKVVLERTRSRVLPDLGPPAHILVVPAKFTRTAFGAGSDRRGTCTRSARASRVAAAFTIALTVAPVAALRDELTVRLAAPPVEPVMAATAFAAVPAVIEKPQLSLDRAQYIVRPGEHQAQIQVLRIGGSAGPVSFAWWTRPSGAKSGEDYRGRLPTTEQFPAGTKAMTLVIPIIANPQRAHTELFYVSIGHPGGGAAIGTVRSAVVIIMSSR